MNFLKSEWRYCNPFRNARATIVRFCRFWPKNWLGIPDVISNANFDVDRLWGLRLVGVINIIVDIATLSPYRVTARLCIGLSPSVQQAMVVFRSVTVLH